MATTIPIQQRQATTQQPPPPLQSMAQPQQLEKTNTTLTQLNASISNILSPNARTLTNLDENSLSTIRKTSHKNALHQSILDGRLKQLHYFLKMGYKVDTKDKYGRTCLMLSALSDHQDYGLNVAKILLKYNANINITDRLGRTPLYLAVSQNREKLFNYIMDNYSAMIDFCQKDNDGNNLLNHVAVYGDVKMLRKVISHMVDRRLELDQRNLSGYSALLLAIKNDKYLNAYELIKDGLSSASLQDYETTSNALEWLLARIKINKESILASSSAVENPTNGRSLKAFLSDGIESKLSFQSNKTTSTCYSDYRKWANQSSCSNNSKIGPISYKTWYNSNNQYYLNNNQCDHVANPNYSTEHHKSRFVPLILTPRKFTYHLKFNQADQNSINNNSNNTNSNNLTLTKSVESFNSTEINETNKLNNDDDLNSINENSTLKEIVQKLYQKIFQVMSQQAKMKSSNINNINQKSVSIVLPEKNITEQNGNSLNLKSSKSPKLNKRSLSSKSKNSNSNNDNNEPASSAQVVHFKDSAKDLYKIDRYRIDTNIFNLGIYTYFI